MIFLPLVHNIALLVTLSLAHGLLMRGLRHRSLAYPLLGGLLFGCMAILGMMTPMRWVPGVIFDGRSIILGAAGLFGGPLAGLMAGAASILYRLHLGGAGTLMGVAVIGESTLLGILGHHLRKRHPVVARPAGLYGLGLAIHALMLAFMAFLPGGLTLAALRHLGWAVLLIYPLGFTLVGLLFVELQNHFLTAEALKLTEARNRALLHALPDLLFVFSRDGRIKDFQAADESLLYAPASSFLEKMPEQVLPPEVAEQTRRMIDKTRETGQAQTFEYDLHMGTPRHFESRVVPCGEDELMAIVRDITERRNAESALRDSHALYQDLVSNNLAGFYRLREVPDHVQESGLPEVRCEFLSDRYCELTGIPRETHMADPMILWRAVHPEEVAAWLKHSRESTRTGKPFSWVGRFCSAEGERWLQFESRRRLLESGERVWTGIVLDVSDRMKAESERQDMERRMLHVQKLESLGVLAGGMAHDFNNLLTAILGHADLAMASLQPEAPALENLGAIEVAARRASDLSRQMLAYSGRGKFIIEAIPLSGLVGEMVQLLTASISKKATLDLRLQNGLPSVEGDATQIRQILLNLITNASEAIGDQGGTITVSTGTQFCTGKDLASAPEEDLREGPYVYLEVADTGCGMDRKTLDRIFDPFFTTKFTGRGLGMAAVLGIVRGHHGAIRVHSEPGRGTTFRVLFPATGQAPSSDREAAPQKAPLKGQGRVLFVDDEEALRTMGQSMLQALGFDVVLAKNGRDALETYRLQGSSIDLVLLDLTMPEMDGEETCRELRDLDPQARVLISSGYTEQEITARFAGAGLVGFLQKPYTLKELGQRVRAALDMSP